jgi:hypothetical protein
MAVEKINRNQPMWPSVIAIAVALAGCDSSTGPSGDDPPPDIEITIDFEGGSLESWEKVNPYSL